MINKLLAWSDAEGKDRVDNLFKETLTLLLKIFIKLPVGVNIIGEHVDYNAGLCLPMALEHSTFIATKNRADRIVNIRSAQEDGMCSFS